MKEPPEAASCLACNHNSNHLTFIDGVPTCGRQQIDTVGTFGTRMGWWYCPCTYDQRTIAALEQTIRRLTDQLEAIPSESCATCKDIGTLISALDWRVPDEELNAALLTIPPTDTPEWGDETLFDLRDAKDALKLIRDVIATKSVR